jgi:glycine hydroxymethyltransferase
MHVIAAKAIAFGEALRPEFRDYQAQVIKNAQTMARTLQSRGLRIVSGRTECHMFLVDLRAKRITGRKPKRRSGAQASPSTRTRSRTIRRNPRLRRESASARRQ